MKWVILQDCVVLIRKHKKSHFIITHMPENFESAAFIDYSHKLFARVVEQDTKNDARVDVILLGGVR